MQVLIEEKFDGISVCVRYNGGSFVSLITRGNGLIGQDISPNAQYMPNIPKMIQETGEVTIRGELLMDQTTFNQHFKDRPRTDGSIPNARNQVAGLAGSKKNPDDLKHLTFVAYEYYGPARGETLLTEMDCINHLRNLGFTVGNIFKLVSSSSEAIAYYKEYETSIRETLPFQTDGLVLKVNSLQQQSLLGSTSNRPDHAVAAKPTPKACITKVLQLTWEMGLSGRYTPVAQVEPTLLAGEVMLRNVDMRNMSYLKAWADKGFDIGATIIVERTGDVIPYLVGIVTPQGVVGPGDGITSIETTSES